jgi:hypothetical protein
VTGSLPLIHSLKTYYYSALTISYITRGAKIPETCFRFLIFNRLRISGCFTLDIRNNYLKRQYKEMRDVRVVFYMYIDAQQILCELVVQHTCADRNKKTIWIPHRATRRVLRTSGLKLLNREGNPYKFLVRWSSRRLPLVLFYNHQRSLARRHSHLPSLLLPRLN